MQLCIYCNIFLHTWAHANMCEIHIYRENTMSPHVYLFKTQEYLVSIHTRAPLEPPGKISWQRSHDQREQKGYDCGMSWTTSPIRSPQHPTARKNALGSNNNRSLNMALCSCIEHTWRRGTYHFPAKIMPSWFDAFLEGLSVCIFWKNEQTKKW